MSKNETYNSSNVMGIIAIIAALISPIIGFILGIASLNKGEKNPSVAVIAIVISAVNFLASLFLYI